MTRRLIGMTVLVAAMMAVPARTWAQEPGHPGMGMMDGPMGAIAQMVHVLQQLDLTQAQAEQIHALFKQTTLDDAQPQVQTALQQLHAAVLADVPDQQAIESIEATLNAAHAAELRQHVELMQNVAQILTPDQRQQLLKIHPAPPGR